MTERMIGFLAGILGFLAVALGAFGAHGLKDRLDDYHLGIFKTGVEYQFIHAIALLVLSVWISQRPGPFLTWATWSFLFGILLFSGSLYLLVATKVRIWGAVTPIGGLAFLVGWALVALAALKR
jgi:uncharacterized membrane protein YgdD (TMEM256/DUF423 family)